jgi:hypothetical protein
MALARRAMFFSEKVPLRTAYPESVDRRYDELFDNGKHVWAHWSLLSKQLRSLGIRRHEFFKAGTNSPLEVMLSDLVASVARSDSKRQRASKTRRKSSAEIVSQLFEVRVVQLWASF